MANDGRWGDYTRILAGLPYDVQAQLFAHLTHRKDLDPGSLYRLPMIHTTNRLTVAPGVQAVGAWRMQTLCAIYGISRDFDNETPAALGATLVYPSEVLLSIDFNQGQTQWIGSAAEPCSLGSIGDVDHVTRVDPIIAVRQDIWNLTLNGDATMLNQVFARVTLHGVKIYSATGAV